MDKQNNSINKTTKQEYNSFLARTLQDILTINLFDANIHY